MKIFKILPVAAGLLALVAAPVLANEPGTWILRAGIGTVQPDSDNLTFTDDTDTVTIDVDHGTSMTLSGTYFFNEHWALDILASLPFEHDIKATVEFDEPDVGLMSETGRIGKTKQIPPTLSFQYHFAPDAQFQPYVGLGANWTHFYDTELRDASVDMPGVGVVDFEDIVKVKLDDSFGVAAQLGGDWQISDHWLLNVDVRWINIESDASVVELADSTETKVGTVEVDPWVYAMNLGYRF